jgi:DtxR family Mn-dependent transcriptional regulator
MEDYLEAIYHIVQEKQAARAKDISARLRVNNSSVTGALRALAEKELVNYSPYDLITLTNKGRAAAQEIVRRHETLHKFFVNILDVDELEAEKAACEMEHSVRGSILEKFVQFIAFMEACPRGDPKWMEGFKHHRAHGKLLQNCTECFSRSGDTIADAPNDGRNGSKKWSYEI